MPGPGGAPGGDPPRGRKHRIRPLDRGEEAANPGEPGQGDRTAGRGAGPVGCPPLALISASAVGYYGNMPRKRPSPSSQPRERGSWPTSAPMGSCHRRCRRGRDPGDQSPIRGGAGSHRGALAKMLPVFRARARRTDGQRIADDELDRRGRTDAAGLPPAEREMIAGPVKRRFARPDRQRRFQPDPWPGAVPSGHTAAARHRCPNDLWRNGRAPAAWRRGGPSPVTCSTPLPLRSSRTGTGIEGAARR